MTEPVYILRTCDPYLRAYNAFQWPVSGYVEAPDWDPEPVCGYGLHGLLWGAGDGNRLNWSPEARWLVVRVEGPVVALDGKVKFKAGYVEYAGNQRSATDFIISKGADPTKVVGNTVSAGDEGTATSAYRGTSIAGDRGTAVSGTEGTSIAGMHGFASAGLFGKVKAGPGGIISISRTYDTVTKQVGEDGILPDTFYVLDGYRSFIKHKPKSDKSYFSSNLGDGIMNPDYSW